MTARGRAVRETLFVGLALLCVTASLATLLALLLQVFIDAWPRLHLDFVSGFPSRFAERAGIAPALVGSLSLMALTALIAIPIGVGAAIYLEEYAKKNLLTRLIELNIANLAGVPSIIYGLLGLALFARYLGLGKTLAAGALTLSLLILPIVVMASREALRTVPNSIREASLALGATKWQTIWFQVLPVALPGILTGCILALSRALGETAPLVTLGALTYVAFLPDGVLSEFTALPIQIFNWTSRPQEAFHANAAAGIVVLLLVLLSMNASAIYLRAKFQKRLK